MVSLQFNTGEDLNERFAYILWNLPQSKNRGTFVYCDRDLMNEFIWTYIEASSAMTIDWRIAPAQTKR